MKIGLRIAVLIGFLHSSTVFAGQGLYLTLNGYLSNSNVQVTDSNCVDGIENIKMNNTVYVDANIDGSCLIEKSWVKLSIQQNGQEVTNYTLTISANGSTLTPQGFYSSGNAVVMASLYPHSGLTGTQDWVTISLAGKEDNWMKQISQIIGNKPISTVMLPGSHDTGTYGINDNSEIANDISDEIKFWLALDPLKMQHLRNWSMAQNIDMTTQLSLGIRYFDLRLCESSTGGLETCHAISAATIPDLLSQAGTFLNDPNHNQEIIILDFNHLYSISNNDIDQLVLLLKNAFGNKIASAKSFLPNSLLSTFWSQHKQVIVIIDSDYAIKAYPDIFWPENTIYSAYIDQQTASGIEQGMLDALASRDPATLFVLQAQETPSDQTIIDGFDPFASNPDSLLTLTGTYKRDIGNWLLQPSNQAQLKLNGNIIIEDFTNGIDLTELAKQLN